MAKTKKQTLDKGYLISFEGGEAVGKSTQIKLLEKALKKLGFDVLLTREPGGSELAESIRKLFKKYKMSAVTELLMVEAARSDHVAQVIKPALEKKKVVICDRFQESSVVYQSFVGGVARELVEKLNRLATGGLKSDLIFLVDMNGDLLKKRIKKRKNKDRFDKQSMEFHEKILEGYRKLADEQKDPPIVRVNSEEDIEKIHQQILQVCRDLLGVQEKQ